MKTGLIVFGHGSSIASANTAVRKVAKSVAKAGGFKLVETAFLDPVRPTLAEAAERLVRRGAERIVVLPYFLTLGLHLQRDLPVLIKGIRTAHPGVLVLVSSPLDEHPGLTEILLDRVRTTLACEGRQDKRKRT